MATVSPEFAPTPPAAVPEPVRPQRHVPWAATVLAVALAATAVYGLHQHSNATSTARSLHSTQATLKATNTKLADAKTSLASTSSQLDDANSQLSLCMDVSHVALLEFNGLQSTTKAISQVLNFNYNAGAASTNKATGFINKMGAIINADGFQTIYDFTIACSPSGNSL